MLKRLVADIMTERPITVKEDASVGDVAHLLLRHRISGVLVIDKEGQNRLVGVFTTTDLLRLINSAFSRGRQKLAGLKRISESPVGKYASRKVTAIQETDRAVKAIAIMHKKNIHTLPVLKGGVVVGVIGKHDVLNMALA